MVQGAIAVDPIADIGEAFMSTYLVPFEVISVLLLVALVANDLQRNLVLWSVLKAGGYFPIDEFNPALYYPANQYDDTLYLSLLSIGLLVSIASAVVLLLLAWRERRRPA